MAKPPRKQEAFFSDDRVADLLDARDVAGLTAALDEGLTPAWRDIDGRGLMHFAAAWNDAAAVDAFAARGVALLSYDVHGVTPQDMAIVMGHNGLAHQMGIKIKAAPSAPLYDLPYKTLDDLRCAGRQSLTDLFNETVMQGGFDALLAIARKDESGFMAADFMGRNAAGDSTVLTLCQRGEFGKLMDVALWKDRPEEFRQVWERVPRDYAASYDVDAFFTAARQARLQNYAPSDFRLGRRPPKP